MQALIAQKSKKRNEEESRLEQHLLQLEQQSLWSEINLMSYKVRLIFTNEKRSTNSTINRIYWKD